MPRDYPTTGQIVAIKWCDKWIYGIIRLVHLSMDGDTIYDIAENCFTIKNAGFVSHVHHIRQTQIQEWREYFNDFDLGI